jgi:PAS domain S-box-containing protein
MSDGVFSTWLGAGELGGIIAGLHEGVVLFSASGQIVAANAAAESMLGVSFDEMRGTTPAGPRWRCLHDDGTAYPAEELPPSIVLARRDAIDDVVVGVYRGDGGVVWLRVAARPIVRAEELVGAVAIFSDIDAASLEDWRRGQRWQTRRLDARSTLGDCVNGPESVRTARALALAAVSALIEILRADHEAIRRRLEPPAMPNAA